MKKMFALLLALSLLVNCFVVMAEAAKEEKPIFDGTVFKGLDGYEYDKFEDTWSYYQAFVKKYSDGRLIIGINIFGDENGISYAPSLYIKLLDNSGNPISTIKSVDFLIDDTKFSYKSMLEDDDSSSVLLGQEGKQIIDAFAKCESVSVKITMSRGDLKADLDQTEVNKTLKKIAKELLKNNVWDYITDPFVNTFESFYPLTIK